MHETESLRCPGNLYTGSSSVSTAALAMPTPGFSALYGITNSTPGSQVRNGFWFEMKICSNLQFSIHWVTAGVPVRAVPTRTSHICRSGWTEERWWLRKTPAGPAEKGGVKCLLNPEH